MVPNQWGRPLHGIVNRGLQLFLIEEYGEEFWRELAVSLDQESGFEAMLMYDDEVTRRLMTSVARRLNCTRAEIWEGFGAFLTRSEYTASFWALLRFGGRDFSSFLASLEEVPGQVQLALPDFYLPPLKLLEPSPGQFELHCGAGLWGLGSIATGLLRAVAQECQISAQVELQNNGAQTHAGVQTEVVRITLQRTARPKSARRLGEAALHA